MHADNKNPGRGVTGYPNEDWRSYKHRSLAVAARLAPLTQLTSCYSSYCEPDSEIPPHHGSPFLLVGGLFSQR